MPHPWLCRFWLSVQLLPTFFSLPPGFVLSFLSPPHRPVGVAFHHTTRKYTGSDHGTLSAHSLMPAWVRSTSKSKRLRLCVSISTRYLHTPSYLSEKQCGEFDRCSGQHPSHQVQAREACNQVWIEFQWFDWLTGLTLQYFLSKLSEIAGTDLAKSRGCGVGYATT